MRIFEFYFLHSIVHWRRAQRIASLLEGTLQHRRVGAWYDVMGTSDDSPMDWQARERGLKRAHFVIGLLPGTDATTFELGMVLANDSQAKVFLYDPGDISDDSLPLIALAHQFGDRVEVVTGDQADLVQAVAEFTRRRTKNGMAF